MIHHDSLPTNARHAHRVHALFNEGKLDAILDLATEDVEIVLQAAGQTFRGREGFMTFLKMFQVAFPDLRIEWTSYVADGEQTACECRWSGTHTGPLTTGAGTIPATGRRVEDARFCEVMRFRNGKLARLVNYQDLASWVRQLGAE